MRIYPYAFRVTSSNLDPSFYWRRGAQLVALNWQNLDKGMMLNHGMFNGTQGWQLKPAGYRSSSELEPIIRKNIDFSIELFAAQDLALPPGNRNEKGFQPYINVQLHVEEPEVGAVTTDRDDSSSDSEKSSYRRRSKNGSGKSPDFEGQKLAFPTVKGVIEDLSFVRLVSHFFFSPPLLFLSLLLFLDLNMAQFPLEVLLQVIHCCCAFPRYLARCVPLHASVLPHLYGGISDPQPPAPCVTGNYKRRCGRLSSEKSKIVCALACFNVGDMAHAWPNPEECIVLCFLSLPL